MTLLLFYLALALFVSFVCSILEAALLSVTPSYIAMLEQEENRHAAALANLKEDIDRPLAAILSLNTVAHTVGAAGVGAQAQIVFGSGSMAAISIILTLLILFLSEIIPKTLGARYWRSLIPILTPSLRWITRIAYPLVWLSLLITRRLASNEKPLSLSRDEFTAMAQRGHQEGIIEADEARMLHNLMRFGSLTVTDVLTPRTVVTSFDERCRISELGDELTASRFSRLPVFQGSSENITGFVLKIDVFLVMARGEDTTLSELRRPLLAVPASQSLRSIFRQLLLRREHMAMVVDEYGGFDGIVTLEDVVETLLGLEIMDEHDTVSDMQKLARRRWRERAKALGLVDDPAVTATTTQPDSRATPDKT